MPYKNTGSIQEKKLIFGHPNEQPEVDLVWLVQHVLHTKRYLALQRSFQNVYRASFQNVNCISDTYFTNPFSLNTTFKKIFNLEFSRWKILLNIILAINNQWMLRIRIEQDRSQYKLNHRLHNIYLPLQHEFSDSFLLLSHTITNCILIYNPKVSC